MKVKLKCSGYLRDFFGQEREEVELPEKPQPFRISFIGSKHTMPPGFPRGFGISGSTGSAIRLFWWLVGRPRPATPPP